MSWLLVWVIGVSAGLMVSAGVFTVLFVVGLAPRFAGRTDTAWCEIWYEEFLIFGAISAGVLSIFPIQGSLGALIGQTPASGVVLNSLLILTGLFAGIFVGCLSIALSEALDGIPIFARRISFKKGLSIAVLAIALGKLAGSLIYFIENFKELIH